MKKILIILSAHLYTPLQAMQLNEANYFKCNEKGDHCALVDAGAIRNTAMSYHSLFNVTYDTTSCHKLNQPARETSNLRIRSSEDASIRNLYFGVKETLTIEGMGPLQIMDTNPENTGYDWFQPGCQMIIAVEAVPSSFQLQLWQNEVSSLTKQMESLTQVLHNKPFDILIAKKYADSSNDPKWEKLILNYIEQWRKDGDDLESIMRADRLETVLKGKGDLTELETAYDVIYQQLTDLLGSALVLQDTFKQQQIVNPILDSSIASAKSQLTALSK